MHRVLESGKLKLVISDQGAQWQSILDSTGKERLWQGDPNWWGRRAPVLFPIVGRLNQDRLYHNGKDYPMGQHGFARDALWECVESTGQQVTHRLTDSEETRKIYPFAFSLSLQTTLQNREITTKYTLHNPDDTAMLYASVGAHPAFLVGEDSAAWRLTISSDQSVVRRYLGPPYLSEREERSPPLDFQLDRDFVSDLITNDTQVYATAGNVEVRLQDTHSTEAIICRYRDLPYLGIWSPVRDQKMSSFLCIEPWQGVADPEGFQKDIAEKPGIIALAPGESWTGEWMIEVIA